MLWRFNSPFIGSIVQHLDTERTSNSMVGVSSSVDGRTKLSEVVQATVLSISARPPKDRACSDAIR